MTTPSPENDDGSLESLKVVGKFHLGDPKRVFLDRFHLRYLCEDLVGSDLDAPIDLDVGFETYKCRDPYAEQLGDQFRWILEKGKEMPRATLKEIVDGADFMTYRGCLATIASSACVSKIWTIVACKFQDVIFLCEDDNQLKMTYNHKKASYPGHKFEQCVTSQEYGGASDMHSPVNTFNQSYKVYHGVINRKGSLGGPISCLYTAEMDCVDKNGNDLEIKTEVRSNYQNKSRKYIGWALQSYLVGINQLVIGHKIKYTNLVDYISLETIESLLDDDTKISKCLAFLHEFLTDVKKELDTMPEKEILKCTFSKKDGLQFSHEPVDSKYAFLTNAMLQRFNHK